MKNIILILIFFANVQITFSQEKLFYRLYYTINPKHEMAAYKKILVVTNASEESKRYMRKSLKKSPYKVLLFEDLFPPYRKWLQNQVDSTILASDIDAVITINVKDLNTVQVTSTSSTSSFIPTNGYSTPQTTNSTINLNTIPATELEIFITDKNSYKNEYVLYASGSVDGDPLNAAYKSLRNLINKLEELRISKQPSEIK